VTRVTHSTRIDLLFTMSDITRAGAKAQARGFVILANGLEMPTPSGGARRDRTDDLLLAKQALSQLSYGPFRRQTTGIRNQRHNSMPAV
jgi:hypothetical protein